MTWNTEKADAMFRKLILLRDPVCVWCKARVASDCSHHFKRDNSGTRFDPRNCDGMDRRCHDYVGDHWDEYVAWKKKQLGWRTYIGLQRMASASVPREQAIIRFQETQQYGSRKS